MKSRAEIVKDGKQVDGSINKKRILKKSFIYFIGNFSSKLLSTLLLPIYAFFINVSDLGMYDYVQSVLYIVYPVILLVIWESILKYLLQANEHERNNIESTVVTFVGVIIGTLIFIAVCLEYFLRSIDLIWYLAMLIAISLCFVWQYFARGLADNKIYVVAGIIGSASFVGLNILFNVIFKCELWGLYASFAISQFLIFLTIEIKLKILRRYSIKKYNASLLKEMLLFSSPLVINNISVWLLNSANKILITTKISAEANGLYSFAGRMTIIITFFGAILSMTLIEEAYIMRDLTEYSRKFSIIIQKIFKIYLSITIISIPAIKLLYLFFKNTVYYVSYKYVFLLFLGSIFCAIGNNFGSAFQVTNRTKYIFITTLVGGIITVGGALLLCDAIGIYGVLFSYVLGSLALMLSRAAFAYKLTGLSINWLPVSLLLVYVVFVGFLLYNDNIVVDILSFIFNSMFIFAINFKDISFIFRKLNKGGITHIPEQIWRAIHG